MRLLKLKLHLNEFASLATNALNEELIVFKGMLVKWDRLTPAVLLQRFIEAVCEYAPFKYPENILLDEGASTEARSR